MKINSEKIFPVLTVSELNQAASLLLERQFTLLWISGEISNFKRYDSGHCYFSLKDSRAQIRCVMFRHKAQALDFFPQDGMEVEVLASPSIYIARGDFQLNVESMRRAGLGALFAAFEALKEKLQKEGLFATEKKRVLPLFPRAIGIVTSLQAAALQDILTTLRRRMPSIPVFIYPTAVQGMSAAPEIIRAIQIASQRKEVDVLIVGRGGGSIEDLWAFNEEEVARALADAPMPVVSAIGHETDFTIADFVADVRAPTPTAAAELVCPDKIQWQARLAQYRLHFERSLRHALNNAVQRLDLVKRQWISPLRQVMDKRVVLNHIRRRLGEIPIHYFNKKRQQFAYMRLQWAKNMPQLTAYRQRLFHQKSRLAMLVKYSVERKHNQLITLSHNLNGFNPRKILARGYSVVRDRQGYIVRSVKMLKAEQGIHLQFMDGEIAAVVVEDDKLL